MTPGYIAELRRLIVVWEFAESLMDSDNPDRQFYTTAIANATEHLIEAKVKSP